MYKIFSKFVSLHFCYIFLILFILLTHFLLVPMIDHVDTMSYHAFARYIATGEYTWASFEQYKIISTGSPPFYSVILAILYSVQQADILLHLIHLAAFTGTVYLIYTLLNFFVKTKITLLVTLLFVLIPGNLIYISYILPEIISQFLYMVYVYLIVRFILTKQIKYLSLSVAVGFFSGLMKYSFMSFGLFALLYFLIQLPRKLVHYIYPSIGIGIFVGWIFIQHSLTGTWGLSMASGLRYNLQMMYRGQILPQESHPSMIEIRKYIPENVDLKKAYWDLEPYLVPYIGYDIIKLSKIVGDVGKAAMYEHPLIYIRLILESLFGSYLGGPFNVVEYRDINGQIIDTYCMDLNTIDACSPILSLKNIQPIYAIGQSIYNLFYNFLFPGYVYLIFFPTLVIGIFLTRTTRILSIIYLVGIIPIAMATWQDPRYILPFYPSLLIIPAVFIEFAGKKFFLKSNITSPVKN